VPKLWTDTIESHRRAVHDAVLDATAQLIGEHGVAGVTMTRVAVAAGVGRATLYKYFADVDAVLLAWHERQLAHHIAHLAEVRDRAGGGAAGLQAVLAAYAGSARSDAGEAAARLHHGVHAARAWQLLHELVRGLVEEGAQAGELRDDVPADELARYCLHALGAAATLPSEVAVGRLVAVTLAGLRPPPRPPMDGTADHDAVARCEAR
jgi:AcrR family transcriptional regulator